MRFGKMSMQPPYNKNTSAQGGARRFGSQAPLPLPRSHGLSSPAGGGSFQDGQGGESGYGRAGYGGDNYRQFESGQHPRLSVDGQAYASSPADYSQEERLRRRPASGGLTSGGLAPGMRESLAQAKPARGGYDNVGYGQARILHPQSAPSAGGAGQQPGYGQAGSAPASFGGGQAGYNQQPGYGQASSAPASFGGQAGYGQQPGYGQAGSAPASFGGGQAGYGGSAPASFGGGQAGYGQQPGYSQASSAPGQFGGGQPAQKQGVAPSVLRPSGQVAAGASKPQAAPPEPENKPRRIASIFTEEQMELFDSEKFSELHFDLQNSLKRFPNNIDAYYGLGLCAMAVGEPERAATHFLKALALDESIDPGSVIEEITTSDPEDWLLAAEELGHSGFFETATKICKHISASDKFTSKVRALASKTKEAINQDFNEAKERIATGNAPKEGGGSFTAARIFSIFFMVVVPLALFVVFGIISYSSYQFTEGQRRLQVGIYKYEQLKAGVGGQDVGRPIEDWFYKAEEYFQKSLKTSFSPFKCLYYYNESYKVLIKLGKLRNKDQYNLDSYSWKPGRFKETERVRQEVVAKIKERNVSVEKMNAAKKEWNEFYENAKKDPGAGIF